jgi:hypothetical protein
MAVQQSIVTLVWSAADPAAAPSGAVLPFNNVPDTADLQALALPYTGTVVGISVVGKPASGDTLTVTPQICTSPAGAGATNVASLATAISNGTPAASTFVTKDQADAQFSNGYLQLSYTTTTSGTYTARDLVIIVYISTGREDL